MQAQENVHTFDYSFYKANAGIQRQSPASLQALINSRTNADIEPLSIRPCMQAIDDNLFSQ